MASQREFNWPVPGIIIPGIVTVSGTVTANQGGTWNVGLNAGTNTIGSINNTAFGISGSLPAGTNAIGSVSVSNFPATQPISGSVSVSNFPAVQPISATSLPLPTGAATDATLTGGNAKMQIADASTGLTATIHNLASTIVGGDKGVVVQAAMHGKNGSSFYDIACDASGNMGVNVQNFPATQPVSGTVAATQSGTWNIGTLTSITNALPTGTNSLGTVGLNAGSNAIGSITNTSFGISGSLPAGTNSIGFIKKQGLAIANAPVYNSYSSTNVTTSAYTQLIASTTSATNMVQVFDSSGQAIILATGAAGSEVIQAYIPPGGADFNLAIAAGTRVAIKALTANATSGYLLVNLLG